MGRIIKRYANRKLYDTRESRYVTLDEIAGYVRDGEEVSVVESETGADLTAVAFAQVLLEEERRKSGFLPLPLLRQLIRGGDRALMRESAGFLDGLDRAVGFAPGRVEDPIGVGEPVGNGGRRPVD